jgi:transposase-like protein
MGKRYSKGEVAAFLLEVRRTGEAVSAVAKRRGVSSKTAYGWVRRDAVGNAREDGRAEGRGVGFAQVVAASSVSHHRDAVVVEIGGAVVRIGAGCDEHSVAAVLTALMRSR